MKLKAISRAFTVVIVVIYTVVLGLTSLAFEAQADVNQMLGTSQYLIVDHSDGTEDTEYYKKTTRSIDAFMDQKLSLIEELTDEGIVLLKNNGTLPIAAESKVTLLGKANTALVYGGSSGNAAIGNMGNSNVNWTLKRGMEEAGFAVNPSVWSFYESQGLSFTSGPETEPAPAAIPDTDLAAYADAAIVVLSRVSGEGGDQPDGYYELHEAELALIAKAAEISENVIVIVNSPSAVAINALVNDSNVDAILQIGGVGARGAKSIAKVLNGTVNPSGRLTDIFAADSRSSVAYQMAGTIPYANVDAINANADPVLGVGAGGTKYTVFGEGIYVGYKYYETRYEDCVLGLGGANSAAGAYKSAAGWNYADEVDYPFGYGLSYTTFTQEITDFAVADGVVAVSVKVKNTGSVAGKDVVQLYVQSPYTDHDKQYGVEKSAIQLVNFGKTSLLQPGQEETISLKMDLYNIASYDAKGEKTWILDAGDYHFAIGADSHGALNNVLAAKGKTVANGMTAEGDASQVRTWTNASLTRVDTNAFTENGFTTENGLYHNNTDVAVTNLLDSADLNNLVGDDATVYLSRSDWEGTWPKGLPSITATQEMIDRITFKTVYTPGEAVGDTYTYGANTAYSIALAIGKDYDDEIWDKLLDQMLVEEMIATVGKNFGAIDPILGLSFPGTSDNDGVGSGPAVNYLSENDQGSTVIKGETRYSALDARMYPSQTVEASTFNQALIYRTGEMMSEDCFYTGLDSLWGPGLNMHRHPYSGRNFEYFSEDSMMSYIMGAQIVAGLQSNGVVAGPKHFAFNDQETDRYGYAVYVNEQAAREHSLRGFEGAVAVAKAKNIMTALNRIGTDWIGVSTVLQEDLLRGEWGFDGYTLTDNALEPYMCGRSIALGTDKLMLLPGNNRSAELNKEALLKDVNLFAGVRESVHRILYTFVNSKAMNGVSTNIEVVTVTPWWQTALIDINIILGCLTLLGLVGMLAGSNVAKRRKAK